jgi:hypothetical protein
MGGMTVGMLASLALRVHAARALVEFLEASRR